MDSVSQPIIPLDFGDSSEEAFKTCNFLVNVLSDMYDQWTKAGSPKPSLFTWTPRYACQVSSIFKVEHYIFDELIWSTFKGKKDPKKNLRPIVTEPFGCIVRSIGGGSNYLVFRGSKNSADFNADFELELVEYAAPTPGIHYEIKVVNGFYSVHNGLLSSLRAGLQKIAGEGQLLTVTGHSLGSALATLAVPEAVECGLQVKHYNSASPKVGDTWFQSYYDSLKASGLSSQGWRETFRLVNDSDIVPRLPPNIQSTHYEHVGTQISFKVEYGHERGNHDPCATYAYAIYHPDAPRNPGHPTRTPVDKQTPET